MSAPLKRTTLSARQRQEVALFIDSVSRRGNRPSNRAIVEYIEQQYGLSVSESTASRISKARQETIQTELVNPNAKRCKPVQYPEFDLALKEFVLSFQHKTILSDAMLIEKAKLIADGLGVPAGALQFSLGWLQKFKERNGIRQHKLQGEAASADDLAIVEAMPALREKCGNYSLDRIYNMDETGLFYR